MSIMVGVLHSTMTRAMSYAAGFSVILLPRHFCPLDCVSILSKALALRFKSARPVTGKGKPYCFSLPNCTGNVQALDLA
jgi:hypothetical protein